MWMRAVVALRMASSTLGFTGVVVEDLVRDDAVEDAEVLELVAPVEEDGPVAGGAGDHGDQRLDQNPSEARGVGVAEQQIDRALAGRPVQRRQCGADARRSDLGLHAGVVEHT